MIYTNTFPINFQPTAHFSAIVTGPNVRFTVLTPRLLRLEYSPTNEFEDRPSQAFWYRNQPVPEFETRQADGVIEIETAYLRLRYQATDAGFTADSLTIALKDSDTTWHYGQPNPLNLLGTARTLDNVDGALALEEGLISRSGWAVYDDVSRLVFSGEGWLEPRNAPVDNQDLYFFGYGFAYQACLDDFTKVAGRAPMLPRWALGNWWSRYWAYSEDELLGLMDEFKAHEVPISVCIVDMDWHITDTGNSSSGWTGYTWNRDLFPDPPAFIAKLHKRGLKTALNLHPADGVHPHEAQHAAIAARLGMDADAQAPVPFDIASPKFTRAYFELLHHPYEAEGVDFWWIDWQQGTESAMKNLDPLWWLNHLHFYDLARNGEKRAFIFSRWGGLGNHRYPIGFSGDTVVTWDSLAFQPYFTATAANVNYGWWSHDIGGHMGGIEEPELYARWLQYGVFSPILRLHCTNNPFHERRPWGYDAETERVASTAMRLRHAFIPYLYTMAWRNHTQSIPPIQPMYHLHPREEPAYHCPDQYTFGSELIAAPFIRPADPDTRLSRQVVWLPEGEWFDFFNSAQYPGNGWQAVYGGLDDIPVFAKAGAIVPLVAGADLGSTANPAALDIHLFPGADNRFELYEDDGLKTYSLTPISQQWSPQKWTARIEAVQGSAGHLPASREYTLLFRGAHPDAVVTVERNGEAVQARTTYDEQRRTLRIAPVALAPRAHDTLTVTVVSETTRLLADSDYRLAACRKLVAAFRMDTWVKARLLADLNVLLAHPEQLTAYELLLTDAQFRALAEVLTGAGFHRSSTRRSQDEAIVMWNNSEGRAASYRLAAVGLSQQPEAQRGPLPKFATFTVGAQVLSFQVGSRPAQGRLTVGGWFEMLARHTSLQMLSDVDAVVQFEITGESGRVAYFSLEGGQGTLIDGVYDQPNVTIRADAADWLALINGETAPDELFLLGKLNIAGDFQLVMRLTGSMRIAPPNKFSSKKWRLDVQYFDTLTLPLGNI